MEFYLHFFFILQLFKVHNTSYAMGLKYVSVNYKYL